MVHKLSGCYVIEDGNVFFDDDTHIPSIDITGTFLVRFWKK